MKKNILKWIKIRGAKVNNLKNINVDIPKNKLVVITGLSGSGKSSLAFDTLYQEGKRRYIESLSTYARQFLGNFEKPNVDAIEGLTPAISIDQKNSLYNSRSTVGTITEIYDYLRALYTHIGKPYHPKTNIPLEKQNIEEIIIKIFNDCLNTKIWIIATLIERKKGTHQKILEDLIKQGFYHFIIDQKIYLLVNNPMPKLKKNIYHDIYIVIDQITIIKKNVNRLHEALEQTIKITNGQVFIIKNHNNLKLINNQVPILKFNQDYNDQKITFFVPIKEARLFSFNTPIGACESCKGLGIKTEFSPNLLLDNNKSFNQDGLLPYKNNNIDNLESQSLKTVCKYYQIDMNQTIKNIPSNLINIILYGSKDKINFINISKTGKKYEKYEFYPGIINILKNKFEKTESEWLKKWLNNFAIEKKCSDCEGARLNKGALIFKINNKNIYQITQLPINQLLTFIKILPSTLNKEEIKITDSIIKEIINRLTFLVEIGLDYLTLSRNVNSLSGGETQRIRLTTQIGAKLSGVLYILDEPSIGLHPKDNYRLNNALRNMCNLGNSLVIVEHDYETILASDYLIDIGPKAGLFGGKIIAFGNIQEIMKNPKSLTGQYLSGKKKIDIPPHRRIQNKNQIIIKNANKNNLKNLNCTIPLEQLVLITGVSGSGKSTLVNEVIVKQLQKHTKEYHENNILINSKQKNLVEDHNFIKKIIKISQSPIGKTPRSNPATYTGVFDDIRNLFATTTEAQIRGYSKSRFSFNIKGGRCEFCRGDGFKKITMHFLPDIYIQCENCKGKKYNITTLDIKYNNKNISDILEMTVNENLLFFQNHPQIKNKLQILQNVGLGYMKLGQSATTLSGGEAQRVKLASELQKKIIKGSLYILDEPTTGLHMEDIKQLLKILHQMANQKASIIIIEHNLDVIKNADYIIDLGPGGGDQGGYIVGSGTPEILSQNPHSYTGVYLKNVLKK